MRSSALTALALMCLSPEVCPAMDCTPLDPRASQSEKYSGKIAASADTLYKIAKAGGSIEGSLEREINNLQQGVPVSEQGQVQLRTLYVFCGMVANEPSISAERKIELFQKMMNVKPEPGPGNAGSKFVSDFAGGSRRVYAANFLGWLLNVRNDEGSTYAEAGSYVINPSSNAWFGPRKNPFRTDALSGDFVLDVVFSVASLDDVGINFQVFGPEPDPNYLSFFIEFLGGRASYGIDKGWIKHNYLVREQLVAEREPLAPSLSAATLRRQTKLTIKREGGDCQVFVNDVLVRHFPVTIFKLQTFDITAAFPSKVVLRAIEARVKP